MVTRKPWLESSLELDDVKAMMSVVPVAEMEHSSSVVSMLLQLGSGIQYL